MPDCECLPKCIFFNDQMIGLDGVKDMLKHRFCRGDNSQCARYVVMKALGREKVPSDLAPNQIDRARQIIAKAAVH